jgi:hypothetical protein
LSKIENRELPSGVVYFLTIFEHNFFLLNDHETDFSLVYHPPRACTTIPSDKRPPSCGVKENVFKTKGRNVKGKIKITATSKAGHSDPDTAEIKRVQPTSTSRLTSGLALRSTVRLTLYNAIYVTLTLRPLTSEINIQLSWVQPNSTSRLTSGMASQSTLRLTLILSGNNITNVYQYITIYMTLTLRPMTSETNMESHKNWVQPTSTLRPTPGPALRSTSRLTSTPSGNNNTNVYQYIIIYMTLTLRPKTSETNMVSHKDPNIADIKCVTLALSSTSRLTSGLASKTTLRPTLNMTFNPNSIWCKIGAPLSSKETSNPTGEKKSMIKTTVARTK